MSQLVIPTCGNLLPAIMTLSVRSFREARRLHWSSGNILASGMRTDELGNIYKPRPISHRHQQYQWSEMPMLGHCTPVMGRHHSLVLALIAQ